MTGRSSKRCGTGSSREPPRASAAIARSTNRPGTPAGDRSSWLNGSRSWARRARDSWRACSPGTGSARTRPNVSSRWRRPTRVPTSWRRWSGPCGMARSAFRRCNASSRHGVGPRRRWTRWPTTIRATWTGSSTGSRHRRDPPPTTKPCWARVLTLAKRPTSDHKPASRHRTLATKGTASPPLHENVTAALRTLGVAVTPEALDAALSAAEKESLSHLEFLHRLLAGPAEARLQRALERRVRDAKFRELTTLDGFDWEFNAKGLDRRTIEQLATCDFVRRHENVILVGQTGLGKSRILQAVGHAACVQGYRVRYATSAKLLQKFTAALADGTFTRMLADYARLDLLLIDEFGFDRLEREAQAQASTFYYRLLDARTGRRSTALATNIDFAAWADYLGDPPLATAFLDRLVDGAVILKLTGRSYRAHRARRAPEAGQVDRT